MTTVQIEPRLQLAEIAKRVFAYNTGGAPNQRFIVDFVDLYLGMLKFIQNHYIAVPEKQAGCETGDIFVLPCWESKLYKTIVTNLSVQDREWAGTKLEREWRNHGMRAWEFMLELEGILELALDSPHCGTGDIVTPADAWKSAC